MRSAPTDSKYVLVIAEGGYPSNQPPVVHCIVSCDHDWEYFAYHLSETDGLRKFLIPRSSCHIPPSPTLEQHGALVGQLQKKIEAELARGA